MSRKEKSNSSWESFLSFPRTFSYEVDAPIDTVVHHLAELDQDAALFRRASQEISILPLEDHYVFRVRRRRHGTITVSAEGQIWQDETGHVIVEGETRINGWNAVLPLILISFIGIVTVMMSMPAVSQPILIIPFAISLLFGALFSSSVYRRDRQRMIHMFEETLQGIAFQSPEKEKRYSNLELEAAETEYDEYQMQAQSQEKRR